MITVFTPTYNRGYVLKKCYESLCSQTNLDFEWLIVDDGSTDDTEDLVNSWKKDNKISIIYIKQLNGGKHVAHNTAVKYCKTNIFVCVDSDDYLTDDAIEIIYNNWEKIKNHESMAGIVALKGFSKAHVVGTRMPIGLKKSSLFDLYDKHKFKGDTILIFKTKILKEHLFPTFKDERFVTEATVYDRISQNYEMLLVDKILYLCEYLNDGYSNNLIKVHRNNPKGYMYFLSQRVEYATSFREKYKASAYYVAGIFRIGRLRYLKSCKYKVISMIALPKALVIFVKPFIKTFFIKYKLLK